MDIKEIFESWVISINPTVEEKEEANRRLEICNNCPEMAHLILLNLHVCQKCGCPIKKKIFSPYIESCPLKKWNK